MVPIKFPDSSSWFLRVPDSECHEKFPNWSPHVEKRTPSEFLWWFPEMEVPQNGWFIVENPIKIDVLGGTPILGKPHIVN